MRQAVVAPLRWLWRVWRVHIILETRFDGGKGGRIFDLEEETLRDEDFAW